MAKIYDFKTGILLANLPTVEKAADPITAPEVIDAVTRALTLAVSHGMTQAVQGAQGVQAVQGCAVRYVSIDKPTGALDRLLRVVGL